MCIKELAEKKRGHPLLLGNEFEKQVNNFFGYLRERGAVVNAAIVLRIAQGIERNHISNLLASNGGYICLGKPWGINYCLQ